MAANNRLFISGKLSKDAMVQSGQKEGSGPWTNCKLNMLVETEIKTKGGGTAIEKMFIDCTVWGSDVSKYQHLTQGSSLEIEGRLKMEGWVDQSGVKKYRPCIVPEKITLPKEVVDTVEDIIKMTNRPAESFKVEPKKFGGIPSFAEPFNDELPF